jgi:alpha-galactosidase
VTRMGQRPLKFTLDVAMSGALGLDLDVGKLNAEERNVIAAAVSLYKEQLRDVVLQGDLYRLESPYQGPRAAMNFVSDDRSRAVLFVYQLKAGERGAVKLHGLNPQMRYKLHEVNLPAGVRSELKTEGQALAGAALMRDGIVAPVGGEFSSAVITLGPE